MNLVVPKSSGVVAFWEMLRVPQKIVTLCHLTLSLMTTRKGVCSLHQSVAWRFAVSWCEQTVKNNLSIIFLDSLKTHLDRCKKWKARFVWNQYQNVWWSGRLVSETSVALIPWLFWKSGQNELTKCQLVQRQGVSHNAGRPRQNRCILRPKAKLNGKRISQSQRQLNWRKNVRLWCRRHIMTRIVRDRCTGNVFVRDVWGSKIRLLAKFCWTFREE